MQTFSLGDVVEITTKQKEKIKGRFIPSSNPESITLKLDSGYNIGIFKERVASINLVKKHIEKGVTSLKITLQKGLPTIAVLHTGGTISSRVSYDTGGVTASFTPEELLMKFPELNALCNIRSTLIGNMFSEDIRFAHYNLMAKAVEKEVKSGVDGIIITHGTDTLGYSAAALAFVLEDLGVPVLFVGAQRSSDRGSSDAGLNLICASQFIARSDFVGVGICMHETSGDESCVILPACKTRKLHTSRRDAFKVVNGESIARVDKEGNIVMLHHDHAHRDAKRKVKLRLFNEKVKVGILKMHPQMFVETFKPYEEFHGLILEGTGLGHAPINATDKYTAGHKNIFGMIQKLATKIPVWMSAQPIFGRLQMQVYSTGRKLMDAGVGGNQSDMLTETAFIKMAWLLSNHQKKDVLRLMGENLRGELGSRTLYDTEHVEQRA